MALLRSSLTCPASATPTRRAPQALRAAFTLVELLVVISIIAVLAAIVLSVTQKTRETANAAKCIAKLRAISTAINLYKTDKMAYPKAAHYTTGFTGQTWWFLDVMPYLGNDGKFVGVDDQKDALLKCPTVKSRGWPFIDYGINGYMLSLGSDDIPIMKVDRPSTTFLVAEAGAWNVTGWTGPTLKDEFVFRHGKAANVVMFDGHVEKVTKEQLADLNADKKMKGLP